MRKANKRVYENGGKGEILTRAIFIKIVFILIVGLFFTPSLLWADTQTLQLDNQQVTKSVSKTSRVSNFSAPPSLSASIVTNTPSKSFAPLAPVVKFANSVMKTITTGIPKINKGSLSLPVAKIDTFKPYAPIVPKLDNTSRAIQVSPISHLPKANVALVPLVKAASLQTNILPVAKTDLVKMQAPLAPALNNSGSRQLKVSPALEVPKTKVSLVPPVELAPPKINTIVPTFEKTPKVNFKQPEAKLNFLPKQNYLAKFPKSGPAIPLATVPPRQQSQPILPATPLIPSAPTPTSQSNSGNAASNTNSQNSGHNSGNSGGPSATPLVLGLFGHFPGLSKRRMSKMMSEISRRLKNGIGIIFGARSPNISQVDACLLAYVHQQGQEEILSNKLGWSQENCGLFCLFGAKKAL